MFIKVLPIIIVLLSSNVYSASPELNDKLISKFRKLRIQLAGDDASKTAVTQRLADLLSERARQKSYQDMSKSCDTCNSGKADRIEALKYYQQIITKIGPDKRSRVMAQMGHLYQLLGEKQKALQLYEKVIQTEKDPKILEEALLSLAEMKFKAKDFVTAKKYYQKVVDDPKMNRKSLAAYKVAWCSFYQGKVKDSVEQLKHILDTPRLLQRLNKGSGLLVVDTQFQEEVSKDLASFLAQLNVGTGEAKELMSKSPQKVKMSNLSYLASELTRLGYRKNAIATWFMFANKESDPEKRYDAEMQLAKLYREDKKNDLALEQYESAMNTWSSGAACKTTEQCALLKERIRAFVLDWNRVEKKNPSEDLVKVYEIYLGAFPKDLDMSLWFAQVYKIRKEYSKAYNMYMSALQLKKEGIISKDENVQKLTEEKLLLTGIEIAELSKNKVLLATAQDHYIQNSKEKTKLAEVKYQQAYQLYKDTKYQEAQISLHEIAANNAINNKEVRLKAANLSLDALALLKNDSLLEERSAQYSQWFPKEGKSFQAIQRTAVLNMSAKKGLTDTEALAILSKFDVKQASVKEKVTYYRNKIILSEKSQKWMEAKDAAEALAVLKNAPKQDVEFAIKRRIWLAELQLDFVTAFKWMRKLPAKEQDPLRLALFADLAQKDSQLFYETYLKQAKDINESLAIASYMVKKSKNPRLMMKKYKKILLSDLNAYANMQLKQYSKDLNKESVKELLSPALSNTPAGKLMWRISFIDRINQQGEKLKSHQLNSKKQSLLKKSIQERDRYLSATEKLLKEGLDHDDWTAQVLGLSILSSEYQRFYENIMTLPVPENLTAEEQSQYMQLISQTATPYQIKSQEMSTKLQEFWAKANDLPEVFAKLYKDQPKALLSLLKKEARALLVVAPEEKKQVFQTALAIEAQTKDLPSIQEIESLKQGVRMEPFNLSKIQSLIEINKKAGDLAMTSYLEARLQATKKNQEGGSL